MNTPDCHRARKRVVASSVIFLALVSRIVAAQTVTTIRTDTSWDRTAQTLTPSSSNTVVTGNRGATYAIPGNVYTIAEAQGRLAGANLFHSFESFSIGSGDAGVFTTTTPTLNNVISRVSGISPTTINGLLALNPAAGSNPNFFLVNPNGITFGAGAQVDVPAAFHVSTADNLRFADGTVFKAGNGSDSTLTIAAPEAFGFLGTKRATIAATGGALLEMSQGHSLSVVGGDVLIDQSALITGDGGDVRVVAAGTDVVEIPLTGALPVADGMLRVVNNGFILAGSFGPQGGGNIAVSAGDVEINGQQSAPAYTGISTLVAGSGNAGNVNLRVARDLSVLNGGLISSESYSTGNAGSVVVSARNMTFDAGGLPTSNVLGIPVQSGILNLSADGSPATAGNITLLATGNISIVNAGMIFSTAASTTKNRPIQVTAGSITIDAKASAMPTGIRSMTADLGSGADIGITVGGKLILLNGGEIETHTVAEGRAGSIKVDVGSMDIDRQGGPPITGIISTTDASGDAGDLDVRVAGNLSIFRGAKITTRTFASGAAGSIKLSANSMNLDGQGSDIATGLTTQANIGSSGSAGNLDVSIAGALSIRDSGVISSAGFGTGAAGSVQVTAASIEVDGRTSPRFTGLTTASNGPSGDAGNLRVSAAGSLSLVNGGQVASATAGAGNAGSIEISAGSFDIDGTDRSKSGIFASALPNSSGRAGDINVEVTGTLNVREGGVILATTASTGNAGSIKIRAENIVIESPKGSVPGGVFSSTLGSGDAGSIDVSAEQTLSLGVGGVISAGTGGPGNGGSIAVTARNVSLEGLNSGIVAQAESSSTAGQAGSIEINAMDALTIRSGGFVSTSTLSSADAGSIKVAARSVLLSGNATSISTTTEGAGQGGNILISAAQMTVDQLANITAETSGKGKAGNITMTGDSLAVMSGGRIEASTSGEGKGGSIAVTVTGDVTVSGVSVDGQTRSGLFAKTQSPSTGTGGGGGGGTGGGGTGGGGTGGGDTGGGGTGGGGTGGGGGTAAKPGSAGNIAITAKNLFLNDGAQIDSSTTSGGAGGSVAVTTAENVTIAGSDTRLTSDATRGNGQGGSITMVAKNITVRDDASVTAATGGKGDAGHITLTALDQLLLQSGGKVTTSTSGSGKGGSVVVQANRVMLDGPGTAIIADTLRPFADLTITINILHSNDGDLVVQLDSPTGTRLALLSRVGGSGDNFTGTEFNDQATNPITSGSAPFTGTFNPREPLAQLINELAAGNWILNVRDQATGNVGTLQNWTLRIGQQTFQSTGASIPIPDNGTLRSTINVSNPVLPTVQGTGEATGIGGDVTVNAGSVTVQNGATMSAITRGSGKGGIVNLQVAGDVSVLNSGRIATDTFGAGQAGDVLINAQNLLLNLGEVSSNSSGSLSGNAGSVGINLGGTLTLLNSGLISSSTKSIQGAAGSIEANAGQIVVDGGGSAILADALVDSSGQTGSLMVNATSNIILSNGGILSIRNDATVPNPGALTPTVLSVSAPNITLKDASITAESTGNSNASDIRIHFTGNLVVDPSSISTSANLGNGGDITIGGGQVIQLDNSQITTSVGGATGNGGNINIQATSLVLNTGFIQANTAAAGASGGNVNINVQTLLPSGNSLTIGGSEPAVFQPGVFGLNVIQAAAPTGVSGTIHSTVPTLDVAGDLSGLTAKVISFGALGRDLCRMGARSSFTPVGRGGLRPGSTGMIRPEGAFAQTTASEAATRGHAAIVDMRDGTRLGALAECRY